MRFSWRMKAWYSVRTLVNVFGGFNFGANNWSLGSGTTCAIGAEPEAGAGTICARLMP